MYGCGPEHHNVEGGTVERTHQRTPLPLAWEFPGAGGFLAIPQRPTETEKAS